jgi:hypothetical protein
LKPSKTDRPVRVKISGLQLSELQEHTGAMCEAFGLDRKIERYMGTRPITLYQWDLECLFAVLEEALKDEKQYSDHGAPEYVALNDLYANLEQLYQQTYEP